MADINDLKDICISSGTLRAEDLLPRFMGILKDYAPEKFDSFIKGYPELDGWEDFLEADWRIISDDTKMNASDDLFGLLNDIAPEGTMFSSTEGDGADFGFWSVEEKLLDDDEGEKALKQMAKDGKSTGEVAADIRYDVATALDMAVDKAEDLMFKFGLDNIYVLRAKGLSPKAIANKILKACESKDEGWLGGFYSRQDVLDAMDGGILNKDWKLEKRFGNWGCYVNQDTGRPLVLQVMVSQDRSGDWGYKPVTSDMGPVDTNIQAAKWLKPRLEEWVEKNPDLAKDVPDYEWGWIEKCLGKETANKDRKNLVSSLVKGDKIKLIDTVADGAVVTFIDMITPTKMRILHNGREMSCKTSFIDRKVEESKDERRDSADYLQEVWDALVSVWDKEKFDMAKSYDDEYECEAITIASKDNEGVRANIYVDDHEGKHPVGFDVIYRYPGDKGVGDQGYYEFQSTDFDETAPEIFAYFNELKGKIKAESKVDDSENILLFQTAKGSEANDAHDALEKLYLDNMDNTVDVVAIRMEDDGADYYRVYATGKRSAVSKFLKLYAQNFGKDAFTDSLDSMWTEPSDFKDLLITESKGDNWVAYYFCVDPQGTEWAVSPHAINGIGNARCVNARGGDDSISIKYVLDKCSPIKDVKGSDIYRKVKELEDRDIVALSRDEAERVSNAADRLEMLKSVVAGKDESCKSEAKKKYYGYGKDDAIDKEDNDFMWQVAYDWFVDKLPEKLARYADKAVTDVIDKDSRAYEEIVTMDDYYDYLETYGPAVIEEITGDLAESKKTESSGDDLASIYGDGDVSTHENSADGFYVDEHDPMGFAVLNNDTATMKKLFSGKAVAPEKPWTYAGWHEDIDAPENKDGSYPYVYDWEREYDLNFVNDWKRIVGDKDNEKALELLLKYAPDFIPSAMDFWNAFHAGYSKGLLRKLFDNIFAVVDKDDEYNNYLGYGDYTYDEVAEFLNGKGESKNEDLNTAKDFVYSIAPIGILVRQASQPGFNDAKNSSDHIIVGFMHHNNTRFIIDWDADKKQGTATRQIMVDDKDSQYGYKWVTPKSNANVTFTSREELKDFVEGSWDNTSSESKNESLTLKQKELKDMARYGEAEDITTISDAEAKELKKKGIETVGVSRGTYGMNGALLRDREGNKYVITARSSNLFYFV